LLLSLLFEPAYVLSPEVVILDKTSKLLLQIDYGHFKALDVWEAEAISEPKATLSCWMQWQASHENQEKKHCRCHPQNNHLRLHIVSVLDVWAGAKNNARHNRALHSKSGLFQQDCLALEAFNSRLKDYHRS
jgi:hypothetical protein